MGMEGEKEEQIASEQSQDEQQPPWWQGPRQQRLQSIRRRRCGSSRKIRKGGLFAGGRGVCGRSQGHGGAHGKLGNTKNGGGRWGGGQGKGQAKQLASEPAAPAARAASAAFFKEESIPPEYVCPISFGIMFSPVIAMDGHSYEQAAIEEWIETRLRKGQPITSPYTNPMARTLIPNLALRNLIRAFCEEHSLPVPTGPAVYSMG